MDIQKLYDSLDIDEKQLLANIIWKDKTFADTAESFARILAGAKIGMSIRLYHVLIRMNDIPLSIIQEKHITGMRNAGLKCWYEFEELRENYYKNFKIK
jgi:hypothetical protein